MDAGERNACGDERHQEKEGTSVHFVRAFNAGGVPDAGTFCPPISPIGPDVQNLHLRESVMA
jgi:hypothetical protein